MNILFLTNVPAPYRIDFFNELGKHCELTVLFEKKASDERDESWGQYRISNFNGVFLKGKSVNTDTAVCPSVVRYAADRRYDRVIVGNYSSPTGIMAILCMRARHIPYWIEGDGGFPKDGRGPKERLKRRLISGAEGFFSTGNALDAYFKAYGAEPEKLVRYPFSPLYESDILRESVSPERKAGLRKKLMPEAGPLVLAVGRFVPSKGFDILLQCADVLRDVTFCFVGGEPTADYLAFQRERKLTNVRFVGFRRKDELREYYQAADLFVLPTRGDNWGLVINEAMANGLPVVTTDRCVAGLELVDNGENGYVVPVDNTAALAEAIRSVLSDGSAARMGERSLQIIRAYTIENMVNAHLNTWLDREAGSVQN